MFRTVLAFIATAMFTTAAFALPESGQPAPSFTGLDVLTEKNISLADFKGKVVVLEWNNFSCPFVHKFYDSGAMQKLQDKAVKDGVVWITINSSAAGKEGYLATPKLAKAEAEAHNSNASYYLLDADGSIGHAYAAKTTPHMFVIDKKGNVAYMGAMDDKPTADIADIATATNYVSMALKALSAGTPIVTTSTRSYGCFVKY